MVGEAILRPFVPGKNRVRMYDREEQAWTLETDVSVERLLLRLFYDDVSHVPRGHVRRVTWSVTVLPSIGHSLPSITGGLVSTGGSSQVRVGVGQQVVGETRSCYYVQTDVDEGQSVTTDIPTAEVVMMMMMTMLMTMMMMNYGDSGDATSPLHDDDVALVDDSTMM